MSNSNIKSDPKSIKLEDIGSTIIEPATEDKQDIAIAAIEDIDVAKRSDGGDTDAASVGDKDKLYTASFETVGGQQIHIVGDGDKYIVSNSDEGSIVGIRDGIPVAGEDSSGNKQNLQLDANKFLMTADFYLAVSQGLVPGHSIVNKFGQNADLTNTTYEDVWDGGGTYTYPADGNADITKVVSTSTADTIDVEVQGLDVTGALTVQTITLTGTTAVILTTPLWRIFRMKNVGAVDNVGEVSAQNTALGIIYAIMQAGNNQTLMALYTIPLGYTGYMYQSSASMAGLTNTYNIGIRALMRPFGGVFQLKATNGLNSTGNSFTVLPSDLPGAIGEKTDIRYMASTSKAGGVVNSRFSILLIEN